MEKLYTAVVTAKGGRDGHIKSTDGVIDMELKAPKAMGGVDGYANPELLFAGAWGSCYLGALGSVGKRDGVDVSEARLMYISVLIKKVKHPTNYRQNCMYTSLALTSIKLKNLQTQRTKVARTPKQPAVILR
jgi:organic hydroperoxide reductase OsmC/OhrA